MCFARRRRRVPAFRPAKFAMRVARHTLHGCCGGAALVRHSLVRHVHSRPTGPAAPLALSLYCLAGEAVAPLVRDPPAQTRLAPHHSTPHACLYDSLRHTPLHRVRACVTARAVGGLQGQAVASRRQRSRAPHAGTARVLLLAVGARRLGRREPLGAAARARAAGERPLFRRAHDRQHGHRHLTLTLTLTLSLALSLSLSLTLTVALTPTLTLTLALTPPPPNQARPPP